MTVISFKNRQIDKNNPNQAILTYEQNQAPQVYAFPDSANSFDEKIRAKHTMIITANDYTVLDYPYQWFQDADTRIKYRQTRISKAVAAFAFYIPNPMIYTNAIVYNELSMTDRFMNAMQGNKGLLESGIQIGENAARLAGYVLNPKVEVIFENTTQRQFSYEFLFAPVSEKETIALKNAIQKLRALAAPKRGVTQLSGYGSAFVWTAPNTFDIQFLHNGVENENIPKIDECVIEQIDVDYAPGGSWVTFSNGYPVQIRMRVNFRERDPNDRDIIERGF